MPHPIPHYVEQFIPDAQTDWQLFNSIRYAVMGTTTGEDKGLALRYLDWWKIINVECFGSRLQPLFISREVSSYGHWIGLCQSAPTRQIKLAWGAFKSPHHDEAVVNRVAGFEDLSGPEHNAAMVILHEMMHQSLFEAGKEADHDSIGWAMLCRHLGDVLGLPYDYHFLRMKKVSKLDANGNPVKVPVIKNGEPVLLKNGEPKMKTARVNIRVPELGFVRDESKPLAPYDAFFHFPTAKRIPSSS